MSTPFADAWLAAMGRACWQGGLALALAWAVCRAFPKLPAAARCWVWRLAYLKVLVALVWAAPVELPLLPSPERVAAVAPIPDAPAPESLLTEAPPPGEQHVAPLPASDPLPGTDAAPPPPVERPSPATVLLALWSLGLALVAVRLAAGFCTAARLRRRSQPLEEAIVSDVSAMLSRKYRIRRPPPLRVADLPGGPLLLGAWRPVILLPASWVAPGQRPPLDQLRLMLAHELAHVRRRDLWWNALAAACHGLLFFHPLAWVAAREYALARESAADADALAVTGAPPADYARMLLNVVARVRQRHRLPFPALPHVAAAGITSRSRATLHRRLTAMQANRPWPRRRLALAAALLALVGAAGLVPWRVVAQQQREPRQQPRQQHSDPDPAAPGENPADVKASGETVQVFRLNHVEADKAAQVVPGAAEKSDDPLLRQSFSVVADARTNSLIVSGPPATVRAVKRLIDDLDASAARAAADALPRGNDGAGSNPYGGGRGTGSANPAGAVTLNGRVTAATVEVRAPIDGTVDEVRFKEGDRVAKGQVLATLNRRKLVTALAQAEARYKATEIALQRQQDLNQKNLTARTEVDAAAAAADEARAAIVLAKEALQDAAVLAPFAGVVSSARAQAGEVVSRGARLGTVVEVDSLNAEFDVPESLLGQLQVGQEIRVQHQSSSDKFPARISFISPEVDSSSGTVRVKAEVENPRGRLRPGATVRVVLPPPRDQEGGGDAPDRAKQP